MAWAARAVFVAVLCFTGALASVAYADDVQLVPDTGSEEVTLNLGDQRNAGTIDIQFLAPSELTSPPDALLTKLQTSDGTVLAGTRSTHTALAQGNRTVVVTVSVAPGGDAPAGTYTGHLLLRAAGVTDARSAVSVVLAPKAVERASLYATLLLIAGAGVGVLARWIATSGTQLNALYKRLSTVETATEDDALWLPEPFRTDLLLARAQLRAQDSDAATTTITSLEGSLRPALDVARRAQSLARIVDTQQQAVGQMSDLGSDAARLTAVLTLERAWGDAMRQNPGFADATQATDRANKLTDAATFTQFLTDFAIEDRRAELEDALTAFLAGDFANGKQKWLAVQPAAVNLAASAAQPLPAAGATLPVIPNPSWLIANAPLLGHVFTTLTLVILGLFTVYDPGATFRAQPFEDAIKLFAWGLGSALAGTGILDLAGKLSATTPAGS